MLGAGRQKAGDAVDFAVGLSGLKKIGERVEAMEPLLFVNARDHHMVALVQPLLEKAVEIE